MLLLKNDTVYILSVAKNPFFIRIIIILMKIKFILMEIIFIRMKIKFILMKKPIPPSG